GFALMVEGISFAGVAEIPVVIFLGQRPGPATGMPSWTEQGDLLFAVHAGHGEFPKIVLAPGDVEEMLELTTKAFDLADIYQTPVIVVSDKVLCESHISIPKEKVVSLMTNYHPNRGKTVTSTPDRPYLRYRLTPDGISERLLPGYKGIFYQANSYEHTPDSHTTEEIQPRIDQVHKRNKKIQTYLQHHFKTPQVFGNLDESHTVFVSWGGIKGAVLEAQKLLSKKGLETAFIHFTHVHPMDKEKVLPLFKSGKRYIMVENNSTAQFAQLLKQQTGVNVSEHVLRYDGRPLFPEDIVNYLG
ncbi:MAG: transketolase C-terminal domain-containing protein, partial [Patescibacteria group bacterium]